MAEATVPGLLDRFSNQQLGEVTRPGRGAEDRPAPEIQQREGQDVGRRPEEVVPEREVETRESEDDTEKLLQTRHKVRTGVNEDGSIIQEDLSLAEIARRGLMEKIVASANQLPNVSRKNAELQSIVEKVAADKAPAIVAAPPAPKPITQAEITQKYMPMLQEFVAAGYVEPDMAEAYPAALTGSMMNVHRLNTVEEKMAWVMEWIQAFAAQRDTAATHALVNSAIDKVAAMADGDKGDKFYAGLKDVEKRNAFVTWLRKDIDPKVGTITPESIQNYWVTFNAKDLLAFTKEAAKENAKPDPNPTRKRAAGDGPGARPGKVETPGAPSMLDRLTDYKLGDQQ